MKITNVVSGVALLAVLFSAACSSSSNGSNVDGGGGHGGGGGIAGGMDGGTAGTGGPDGGTDAASDVGVDGGDGPAESLEFTDFVKDLIQNETSSTTAPETITGKMFKDSMNPAAFDGFFTP